MTVYTKLHTLESQWPWPHCWLYIYNIAEYVLSAYVFLSLLLNSNLFSNFRVSNFPFRTIVIDDNRSFSISAKKLIG